MKSFPAELHAKPAAPATLFQYIFQNIFPVIMLVRLYVSGLPGAIVEQLRNPNPINLINPLHWKQLAFNHGFSSILAVADEMYKDMKTPLLQGAYGRVLEVGAGAGNSVGYYDQSKIERLFCLEPCAPLREKLIARLERVGLAKKTTVIPVGLDAQSRHALLEAGIEPESLDTIVLFQVLCSVPNPKAHLEFLQSLLKPGGQVIVFEHVGSKHGFTRTIQNIWNPIWSFNFGGCDINRDSGDWLRDIGGWKQIDLKRPVHETTAEFLPHDIGRLVKA
ncbi:predicted methyltransferase [Moesziomyces antarcticus T-34]|uniref:Predicted methyltransferase n=1 Tax=Pseudozyma antarctica (strain T-34) TaxID=1151754 RepID=M9ME30_PSEA3|nr:predicted methyltransferase [Moesziomyces antarcticus T-34]